MDLLTVFLGAVLVLLWLFYRKRKRGMNLLKQIGIPGPEPHWFYGNILLPKDRYLQIAKWTKEYGKTYGFYEGPKPWIISSDLDFIEEFLIKQFSCFHAREVFQQLKPKLDTLLAKMQTMKATNKPVDVHDIYQKFTIDVIADVAFGITLDAQNKTEDRFLKECREAFKYQDDSPLIFKFAALFPELRHYIYKFFSMVLLKLVHIPHFWIIQKFAEIVSIRRSQQVKRVDLMQLLMDAVENTENLHQQSNQSELKEETEDGKLNPLPGKSDKTEIVNLSKTLSDYELVRLAHIFLLAGYETGSNALTYLTYLLAMNPDKQEKLVQEIQEHFQEETDVTYDLVMNLPYLNMCVMETLRLYPVAAGSSGGVVSITLQKTDEDYKKKVVFVNRNYLRVFCITRKKKSKIIYLLRNPKSVASSYYNLIKEFKTLEYDDTFSGYLPMYMDGVFDCWGNWFNHVVNYWQIGKEQNNVMYVFFEELLKAPSTQLKLVSAFLGLYHTLEFYNEVIAMTTFEKMKSGYGKPKELLDKYDSLGKENSLNVFRKGTIDDWKNTFTVAQSEMFDAIYKETVGKHPDLFSRITFS